MKKKLLTILLPFALLGGLLFQGGCVKEDFDTTPVLVDSSYLVKSATIAELKKLIAHTDTVYNIEKRATITHLLDTVLKRTNTTAIVIEGYVTSSDSTGNFYEVVTIQDQTGGIDIKINGSGLYSSYRMKPGQKVLVKVNNLYIGYYRGIYQLGASFIELGAKKLSGIATSDLPKFIERTGTRKKLIPDTLTITQINANTKFVQKLICIKNVQFKDTSGVFSVPGENSNRTIIDPSGNSIILRTSGYASFSQEKVPAGSGTITGVLSTYDATRQLYIRGLDDIKFNNQRNALTIPTPNKTIAQLKAMCTSDLVPITQNVVITGIVNSNDEYGNVYKQLFIQDNSGGIEIKVEATGLYPEFPVGTKVVVNCKGLYVGKYHEVVQLGSTYNGSIGRMSQTQFYKNVYVIGYGSDVTPVLTTIGTLNDNMIGKLISLENVQFTKSELGLPWFSSTDPTASAINRNIEDASRYTIIVRNSKYSSFANNILPSGSGKITAILTKYDSDYQLTFRDLRDISLTNARFEFVEPTPNTTIAELKALCTSNLVRITQDKVIQGVVVGNDESGNLYKQLFIADESGAIEFKVDMSNLYTNYPVGTKIIVNCNGLYVGKFGGIVQLGGIYDGAIGRLSSSIFNSRVFINSTGNTVTPVETTIPGINDSMIGKLIKLQNVQFIDADLGKIYAEKSTTPTNRRIEDASGNTIIVRTSGFAKFQDNPLPDKSGTIVAILSKYNSDYQLYIRKIGDVTFDQTRMP